MESSPTDPHSTPPAPPGQPTVRSAGRSGQLQISSPPPPSDLRIRTSVMAVFSTFLGMLGLFIPGLNIVAMCLGVRALNQIDDEAKGLKGRGMSLAGIVLGSTGLMITCGIVAFVVINSVIESSTRSALKVRDAAQLQSIHQQMIVYAQSNKSWYPGLSSTGAVDPWAAVSNRYGSIGRLVKEDFLRGKRILSPKESDASINAKALPGVATSMGSFAVLEYAEKRTDLPAATTLGKLEWRETSRNSAIVLSDRELATGKDTSHSLWSKTKGQWQGSVIFNDGHIQFELSDKGFDGNYGESWPDGDAIPDGGVGTINNLFDLEDGNGRMTSD